MRLLLDSHTYLWFVEGNAQISDDARRLIEDPVNEKWISIASVWEVAIKASLGKLVLSQSLHDTFSTIAANNGIAILPITVDHVLELETMTFHHRDPFDRLLAAQCLRESMPLISADSIFDLYGVKRVW